MKRILSIVVILGAAALAAQTSAFPAFQHQKQLKYPGAETGRPDQLCDLIYQSYGRAWENLEKVSAHYNEQGFYTSITRSNWSPAQQDWLPYTAVEYSYRDDNQPLHADMINLVDGEWINYRTVDWSYEGENLDEIVCHWYQNGVEEPYTTTEFVYDPVTGYLAQVNETLWCFSLTNPILNKYDYGWDAQGRKAWVQKYYKRANDSDWIMDLRDLYSYLPEDESTYAEHLAYAQSGYALSGNIFYYGPNPYLIDQQLIQYHIDAGVYGDYYEIDHIYDQNNLLLGQQRFLTFMGMHDQVDETRYSYENDRLVCATHYEISSTGGLPEATDRCLYVYSGNTGSDDPAVPAVSASISTYPNPFRDSASLQVIMPKSGYVNVSVYNLRGQKVRELNDASLPGGQHQLVWDGKDSAGRKLEPGIYIIRLRSESACVVCKSMLM